jgi:Raf kinase inhibitor-like YbhB/YbcL family protein
LLLCRFKVQIAPLLWTVLLVSLCSLWALCSVLGVVLETKRNETKRFQRGKQGILNPKPARCACLKELNRSLKRGRAAHHMAGLLNLVIHVSSALPSRTAPVLAPSDCHEHISVSTCTGTRLKAPSPYDFLPHVPSLRVTSSDIADGEMVARPHLAALIGGQDISPSISWAGAPNGTESFAVTVFDPDAPTTSGFWHWFVFNIPANITELPSNAGAGVGLPAGAKMLSNDNGLAQYSGPNPPPCHGPHRYLFAVHALGTATLGDGELAANASCAVGGFHMFTGGVELARGIIAPVYSNSSERRFR